jgi:hypothetical protein
MVGDREEVVLSVEEVRYLMGLMTCPRGDDALRYVEDLIASR